MDFTETMETTDSMVKRETNGKDGERGPKGLPGHTGPKGAHGKKGSKGEVGRAGTDTDIRKLSDRDIAFLKDNVVGRVVDDIFINDNDEKTTFTIDFTRGKSKIFEVLKPRPKGVTRIGGSSGIHLDNQVIVKKASDLAVIDSSKEYFIDGIGDMGSQQITVPAGGMTIKGYNFDQSQLVSSENNYDMFSSASSGNFLATDVAFEVSGTASKLFALVSATGDEAIEFNRVNFNNWTTSAKV